MCAWLEFMRVCRGETVNIWQYKYIGIKCTHMRRYVFERGVEHRVEAMT